VKTIWKGAPKPFGSLDSDITCDTAIIGGGIAGLWCGYKLASAGQKVCILEAKRVGSGVTSGSTAILTFAQDVIYKPLIKKHGEETAKKYLNDTKKAMAEIKKLVEKEKIDCDFESIDFVLFSEKKKGRKALIKEQQSYADLGYNAKELVDTNLPYQTTFAMQFPAYQFNPLKLCAWLADYIVKNGGKVFDKTLVTEAPDDSTLKVGKHTVTANNFIVATHFPYINLPGFYWLKMYQDQNYAIAFTPLKEFDNFCKGTSYESIDKTGFEYRRIGNNILVDGVPVRTGKKPYRSKYRILEEHILKTFGETKETARFCAQDCITMDKLPYAGRYSHFADNVFVVTGFNKWGMTNSYVTASVVTDMILGKRKLDDDNIYSPQRVALFVNLIETVGNVATIAASFANDLLNVDTKKFERIGNGQGAVIKYKGHRLGASRDDSGEVSLISAICPHMGCNLKWNKDERTFDCPCHGSRFDTKGEIINNPSTERATCIKLRSE